MVDSRKEALEGIIQNKSIRTVFQPIISLRDGSILGHEALSRITCENEIKNPDMLFNIAKEFNRLWDLELLCRTTALEAAFEFMVPPYNKKIFLNVDPNTMHDTNFKKGFTKDFLTQFKITPNNIIFEITERNVITDMAGFRTTIDHYKSQDYKIAIDDAGAGYSGLNLISDIKPNYIKLDMNLVHGVDTDSLKYALIKGMVELSKVSNIYLIAEGIETEEERVTLVNLGVQYGQGYYIQRPNDEILDIKPELLQSIKGIYQKKKSALQSMVSNISIKNLCTISDTVSPNEMILNVYNIFKENLECVGLCVVENDRPVGIVTQEKLALKLCGHYGFTLNQNKTIASLMDKDFLTVDYKTPVNMVSTMAMARTNDKLYDFIVVTEDDKYIGTVTIKDLLQKTTELEVTAAKHQNPLSGLPGNILIEQRLSKCIKDKIDYSVAYLDIDNFKAYNDIYGFENGDLIIRLLADILKESISDEQFVGHIGGDDFVIIVNEYISEDYFEGIIKRFEIEVLHYYHKFDIENGYVTTANRHGEIERFPLITLTCVVADNQTKTYSNAYELTETLAGLKKDAKQKKNC